MLAVASFLQMRGVRAFALLFFDATKKSKLNIKKEIFENRFIQQALVGSKYKKTDLFKTP